jgi:hypothetical protein
MQDYLCEARIVCYDTVYTIGDTDFTATRDCRTATTKSILCEKIRYPICEACAQNRKKGEGWHGWFDDRMTPDATYIHSSRFYEALLEAYKGEGLGEKADPGTLYRWFQKNLAEGEREELEEELGELKAWFESLGGNKPDDMPFGEFLGMVKRRMVAEKRLRSLTSSF